VFRRVREEWRTDRARLLWFVGHAAALAVNVALDRGRGNVFVVVGVAITASYGIGYLVLTVRAARRERSESVP
jgi:hypothetical protein